MMNFCVDDVDCWVRWSFYKGEDWPFYIPSWPALINPKLNIEPTESVMQLANLDG